MADSNKQYMAAGEYPYIPFGVPLSQEDVDALRANVEGFADYMVVEVKPAKKEATKVVEAPSPVDNNAPATKSGGK